MVYMRRKNLVLLCGIIFVTTVVTIVNYREIRCSESVDSQRAGLPQDPNHDQEIKLSHGHYELQKQEENLRKLEARLLQKERDLNRRDPSNQAQLQTSSLPPTIFAITPTYPRAVQKAELVRLSQTLLHVRNLHWIIVEDWKSETRLVRNLLESSGLKYTLLNVATPPEYKLKQNDPNWLKPRGVLQRNLGLKWIRDNIDPDDTEGVVYFLDDDNTYDIKVFEEMRYTKKVSVWPVALVGALRYESPIIKRGKVSGWFTYWKPERPFAMDMAGFAINIKYLYEYPSAWFSLLVKRGYQESSLLTQFKVTLDDLEPKADNCTKILVWHTRTEKVKLTNEARFIKKRGYGSDLNMEI